VKRRQVALRVLRRISNLDKGSILAYRAGHETPHAAPSFTAVLPSSGSGPGPVASINPQGIVDSFEICALAELFLRPEIA